MTSTRKLLIAMTLACLGPISAPQAQDTKTSTRERVLEQIRTGEVLYRDDLVEDAVQRLYRIEPNAPEGLVAQIHLAIKRDQPDQANALLQRLRKSGNESPFYRQGEALIRLATPQSQTTLTQARLFASVGKIAEARQAYDSLFKGVYPTADFALEYWLLRSREPESRKEAITQLTQLVKKYPRHPRLLLSMANFSFADDQPSQALTYLHSLANITGQRETAAMREYDYLVTLPISLETANAWREFNKRYAGLAVQRRAQERLDAQEALLSDPIWREGRQAMEKVEAGAGEKTLPALQAAVKAYPKDAGFLGALGLALLRTNNRTEALRYFQLAKDNEPLVDRTSRWDSLIASSQDWLKLEQADRAFQAGQLAKAETLYTEVSRTDPRNIFALIGLADIAMARKQPEPAWLNYRKAFVIEPGNESAQNGMGRYLATLPPMKALDILNQMPKSQQKYLLGIKKTITLALLETQADEALKRGDQTRAIDFLTQAQQLNLEDPWLSYRLATLLLGQGQKDKAMTAFDTHLKASGNEPTSRYAHALLLESTDAWEEAVASLNLIDRTRWTDEMRALEDRASTRARINEAGALFTAGMTEAAIELLEREPQNTLTRLQVAEWSTARGDYAKADKNYETVLKETPDNVDAKLGQLENWLAMGKPDLVRKTLNKAPPEIPSTSINGQRRLAGVWNSLGDVGKARQILAQAAQQATAPNPLLYRDYARTLAKDNPEKSLDLYHKAMIDAEILTPDPQKPGRDDAEFTRAMLVNPDDDWLRTSIRADADELYRSQNTTITLATDGGRRADGTPGISRVNSSTTMLQLDHPIMGGSGFLRADHTRLDAGLFETTETGEIDERFGTCIFPGIDSQGNTQSLPGCTGNIRQKVQGTHVGLGWKTKGLGFDLGRTADSFPVSNWVGGINLEDDIGQIGWNLNLSRRPLSNSLLSLAGTTDPRTGIIWGGVVATGATLGLSWDEGLADGVWSSFGQHKLRGRNVADNSRTRLMGGYYRRLINEPNRVMTVGVNVMHWRYQKNLGSYTLGQGGYYSPQQYNSGALPLSYAHRNALWSFAVRGAVSYSMSSTKDQSYYPLASPISGPAAQLAALGVSGNGLQAGNINTGGSSRDWGYALSANIERRLNGNWVVGGGFDLQRSPDFAPSRLMLYMRYTLEPWFGNLQLNPSSLTPYADFN